MDLQGLKAVSKARDAEEKRLSDRRRNAIVLTLRHLLDAGYIDSYERLSTEAGVSLSKVDVADNVDLLRVIQEFEESYELKFGRKPKLVRSVQGGGSGPPPHEPLKRMPSAGAGAAAPPAGVLSNPPNLPPVAGRPSAGPDGPPVSGALAAKQRRDRGVVSAEDAKRAEALERRQRAMDGYKPPADVGAARVAGVMVGGGPVLGMSREEANAAQVAALGAMAVQGAGVSRQPSHVARGGRGEGGSEEDSDDPDAFFERRLIKPLPSSLQGELRELGSAISRDIFTQNPNVRWEDIAGLDTAKKLLKEAVVQPIKYPELFTGLLAPWKGVLLYGPPGTGKTMLAKAVATECRTTFFNVQASTIISKWRGDSEKLVRVLFELARHHAPSTIFMDEIDALMMARGGEGEHEASRRMKTELLIQMDGLAKSNALVFVLCATNLPWELDMAMLRRLEKRILVPLPSHEARARMFESLLDGRVGHGVGWDQLARATEGYSGSDVMLVAKEAAMRPLRRLMAQLESVGAHEAGSGAVGSSKSGSGGGGGRGSPSPVHGLAAVQGRGQPPQQQQQGIHLEMEPITPDDVTAALAVTKPSARLHQPKYDQFNAEYGQTGT